MALKFIFLDVDGVLNTRKSRLKSGANSMDPALVANLDWVLSATGALLVISSSWRLGGIGKGSDFYQQLKIASNRFDSIYSKIHGATPHLPTQDRKAEVLLYADIHKPSAFVAVDDDAFDLDSPPSWLVITSDSTGLDDVAGLQIISML